MASDRPFPPSARRLALARAAGQSPASPILVGALGCAAAAIALAMIGSSLASRVGAWIRAAVSSASHDVIAFGAFDGAQPDATSSGLATAHHPSVATIEGARDAVGSIDGLASTRDAVGSIDGLASARDIVGSIIAFVLPLLGAIAIAVVLAHLAQTRAVWFPRRKLPNAPAEDPQRGTRGAMAIANALIIGTVAVGWLFAMAPRIATLAPLQLTHIVGLHDAASRDAANALGEGAKALGATALAGDEGAKAVGATALAGGEGALLVVSFLAALAIAWVALGAFDALVRYAGHVQSLRMTHEEQRADQRLGGADPRWRARREKLARGEPVRDAVAGASVLVLGDGVAVAIAWDVVRRPVPTRTASGRGARATQLLGLARKHAVPVHREAELAALLAGGEGPVPEGQWPRLAEIVAATSAR